MTLDRPAPKKTNVAKKNSKIKYNILWSRNFPFYFSKPWNETSFACETMLLFENYEDLIRFNFSRNLNQIVIDLILRVIIYIAKFHFMVDE